MKQTFFILSLLILSLPIFGQKITFGAADPDALEMRFTLDQRDTSKMEYIMPGTWILEGFIVTTTSTCLYDSANEHVGETWDRGRKFYSSFWDEIQPEKILMWREFYTFSVGGSVEYAPSYQSQKN